MEAVKEVVEEVKQEKRGRPKKPQRGRPIRMQTIAETTMIKLLATLMKWNISQTHRHLTDTKCPTFRKICFLPLSHIPSRRTLQNRWNNPKVISFQQRVLKRLLRKLLAKKALRITFMDMSDLPVSMKDKAARFGYCGKGPFWGYKFFMLTSQDGIPIAVVVSKANKVEISTSKRLLRQVERRLSGKQKEGILLLVADAGYDGEEVYKDAEELLKAQLLCQVNPRRDAELKRFRDDGKLASQKRRELERSSRKRAKGILISSSKNGRKAIGKRIFVEQTIKALKIDLGMGCIPHWIRGVRRVMGWVMDHVFLFVSIAYCNKLHRRPLRQLAPYLI